MKGEKLSIKELLNIDFLKKPDFYCVFFILIGIFLRLKQYLFNRSLWLDEASLALNVIDRDFAGLFKPLDYYQGAPPFFLTATKMLVSIFGDSEPVLRLFPLVAGVVSIVLFYFLAKSAFNNRWIAVIAVAFFALNTRLIYFSQEFKQYSSDVMFTLAMLLLGISLDFNKLSYTKCLFLGVAVGLCLWFSHPLVFTAAGVLTAHILCNLIRKNYSTIAKIFIFTAPIVISFGLFYFLSLKNLATNPELLNYWAESFLKFSIFDLLTAFLFSHMYMFPFASYILLVAVAALAGMFLFFRKDRFKFLILVLPMVFCAMASFMQLYPFGDRFILFLLPIFILFMTKPLELAGVYRKIAGVLLVTAYCFVFFSSAGAYIDYISKNHAFEIEQLKPVLLAVKENIQPEDTIYLYYGSQRAADYYLRKIKLDNEIIIGISSRDNIDKYFEDLAQLKHKTKIWLIFSHLWRRNDEIPQILGWLFKNGELNRIIEKPGALVIEFTPKRK